MERPGVSHRPAPAGTSSVDLAGAADQGPGAAALLVRSSRGSGTRQAAVLEILLRRRAPLIMGAIAAMVRAVQVAALPASQRAGAAGSPVSRRPEAIPSRVRGYSISPPDVV